MEETITLEFDGGSRGNPGPAGIGVVLRAQDGTPLVTLGRFIGRATNNVAEYRALITGLQKAMEVGTRRLRIRGDSELIIRQMTGIYRVKHPDLRPLFRQAQDLLTKFELASFEHNLRHRNRLADKLANLAMDRRSDVVEVLEDSADPAPAAEPRSGDIFICPRCGCAIELKTPSPLRAHQLRPFICQCGMRLQPPAERA